MASSSPSAMEPSPETSQGTRYRLTRTLCFDDIPSKFAKEEIVLTDKFFCQYDPVPTVFRIDVRFGTPLKDDADEKYLRVYVQSASRDATVTLFRFQLFNDKNQLLENKEILKAAVSTKLQGW